MRPFKAFLVVFIVVAPATGRALASQLLGPTPYRSFADSPFNDPNIAGLRLEDFEDGLFNTPGVTSHCVGVVGSTVPADPILIDSVDGDDGDPSNGSCLGCDAFFHPSGTDGLRFAFESRPGGGLPSHAGIAWTDGTGRRGSRHSTSRA